MFAPLSAEHHAQYWALLIRLFDRYFGPDALLPPEGAYQMREVTREIENFLLDSETWIEASHNETPTTPLNIRANYRYRALVASGWLREESRGLLKLVYMHPIAQRLLEVLRHFAEEGLSVVIGGKVQIIYNQLTKAASDAFGEAAGFHEAALEARRLISAINSTGVRISEVLDDLREEEEPSRYIDRYFARYITELFLRDYHELLTDNHPFRHRGEILALVYGMRDNPDTRTQLIAGFQKAHRLATYAEAERLFETDCQRFLAFQHVDTHLQRIAQNAQRVQRQVNAYIEYRVRTSDQLDLSLTRAIESCLRLNEVGLEIVTDLVPGGLFEMSSLREPRARKPVRPPHYFQRKVLTLEQRALVHLQQQMALHRVVSPRLALTYLRQHAAGRTKFSSDELPVESIQQLSLLWCLSRAAAFAARAPTARALTSTGWRLSGVRLELRKGAWTENELVRFPRFTVHLDPEVNHGP